MSVVVTLSASLGGQSFSFNLPNSVLSPVDDAITATALDGSALPSWLQFVPETRLFVASAVPLGALPYRALVVVQGQRTVVLISERLGSYTAQNP